MVEGPTLDNAFPADFFGSFAKEETQCAISTLQEEQSVAVTVVSITATGPFTVERGEPSCAFAGAPAVSCQGYVFPPGEGGRCRLNVELPVHKDPYETGKLIVSFSARCTDAAVGVCKDPTVASANPTPDSPVTATWSAPPYELQEVPPAEVAQVPPPPPPPPPPEPPPEEEPPPEGDTVS